MSGSEGEGNRKKKKKQDKPNVPFAHSKKQSAGSSDLVSFRGQTCPRQKHAGTQMHNPVIANMSESNSIV